MIEGLRENSINVVNGAYLQFGASASPFHNQLLNKSMEAGQINSSLQMNET
jgi:hypothetical protein